jgi:hypothetical protein
MSEGFAVKAKATPVREVPKSIATTMDFSTGEGKTLAREPPP